MSPKDSLNSFKPLARDISWKQKGVTSCYNITNILDFITDMVILTFVQMINLLN